MSRKPADRNHRPALETIKNWRNLVGVEIGVQNGINAEMMLKNLNIKTLYLIDPYIPFPYVSGADIDKKEEIDKHKKVKANAHSRLEIYRNKIIWIEKYSWDAISLIPDNLDFIYIDGDHREIIVEKDLELYYPKVKDGGLFSGHDYHKQHVKRPVNKFLNDRKEKIFSKNWDWWCFKNKR